MPYLTKQQILTLSFLVIASLMLLTRPSHADGRYCKIDQYHHDTGSLMRAKA